MVFQMPRFFRRWLRRRMHPMREEKAWDWKTRLSFIYAVIAWNAGGIVLYQIAKGNKHWPTTAGITTKEEDEMRPAVYFANILGIQNPKVIRISGFNLDSINSSSDSQPHEQEGNKNSTENVHADAEKNIVP